MQTERIHSAFEMPDYVNLYLELESYITTVTFKITKEMYMYMKSNNTNPYMHILHTPTGYYCSIRRRYKYSIPFTLAFYYAKNDKNNLMISMREAKIKVIKLEIAQIQVK